MASIGYINQNGDTVIDFEYDYVSPFININMFDKKFQIALVCKDGKSSIIMKNQRVVKSYVSESSPENYGQKIKELEDFYKNDLKQTLPMEFEIEKLNNFNFKVPAYNIESEDYTYRYNYNDQFDITVTKSSMGLGDTYYLIRKGEEENKLKLECENLSYDENYLYLLSNGDLPYFSVSQREQGWFNSFGRKTTMKGKAQILELIDQTVLLRNYNDNTVYFIDTFENIVSSIYKDIFICPNDLFLVENNNNKITLINKEYAQVFSEEYDFVDTSLAKYGLFVCGNFPEKFKYNDYGYVISNLKLIDSNGNVLIDNLEQVYGTYYKLSDDIRDRGKQIDDLKNRMKNLDYEFVGDKFYSRYENK